ncbi:unnamed protein product [Rotaria magnacalcarata]|uniref:DYW domain-containing protein n=1 Tax=Rotaria magnacalcarata TaxID=392030 RepID=A0A8S2K442_9BILA|nr:unnamed protein product [Rotaria magnacalcarata]
MFLNKSLHPLYRYQYLLIRYRKTNKNYSITSSSSNNLNSTMKSLVDSKQYEKALKLFNEQSQISTDFTINMAIKACTKLHDYQQGVNIKEKLSPKTLNNPYIQTSLIHFYMQCHKVDHGYHLFSKIVNKSNPMYASMFKGLITNNMSEKVLDLFDEMIIEPDSVTLTVLFNACAQIANNRAMKIGKNLLHKMPTNYQNNNVLLNSAIDMLMKFRDIENAEHVFQSMKKKDIISYNVMIKGYATNEMSEKALNLFEQMHLNLDNVTYIIIFNLCAELANDRAKNIGKKLLVEMPNNYRNDNVILNSAVHMLTKFGDMEGAENIFRSIKKKTIINYGRYVANEMSEKALDLFEQIHINLDHVTYTIVFNACAQLANDRAKKIGKKLLDEMPNNYRDENIVLTSAIHMLMKFGNVENAENIFQSIKKKDIITYNSMIKGYVANEMSEKALDLFEQIHINLDHVTYTIVFNACAQLVNEQAKQIGKKLLDEMPNNYRDENIVLASAIHMLMKFGDVKGAEDIFQSIKKKHIVAYGALLNGYNSNDDPSKCFKILTEMQDLDIIPNEIIWNILIGACSQIGMLLKGQYIVDQIPLHMQTKKQIQNSLIDMWGKCGSVKNAEDVYKSVSDRDAITYNAMINTFGRNGMGFEAIKLYREMPNNLRDEISHICILNACSHSGLLDQAQIIFNEIPIKTERIITIMIDCLSRLFVFDEAQKLIDDYEKTNAPYFVMYMALLSGARNNRNMTLSEKIYNRMKTLFPDQKQGLLSGSILLSNVYSSLGKYEQAKNLRYHEKKELGVKVKIGLSWTEVYGELVRFKAHDHSHPRSSEIYAEFDRLSSILIKYNYKFDSTWITRQMNEEETIESVLCGHSEKLAIGFNLIQKPIPEFIQITKNLRVCGDCHEFTKLIAKFYQRNIIVRDANRIHHFYPNGQCSCQDHF